MQVKDDFQSQHLNVYKHRKSRSTECESLLFVTNHRPYLWGISTFFYLQLQWILQLWSCFITWYEKERSIKLRPSHINNGGCLKTLNLLHLHFVMSSMKQNKNWKKLSRVCSMDWKSSFNRNSDSVSIAIYTGLHVHFWILRSLKTSPSIITIEKSKAQFRRCASALLS